MRNSNKELGMKRIGTVNDKLQIDELERILQMMRENGVTEFKYEREGEKISLRRGLEGQP